MSVAHRLSTVEEQKDHLLALGADIAHFDTATVISLDGRTATVRNLTTSTYVVHGYATGHAYVGNDFSFRKETSSYAHALREGGLFLIGVY